MRTKIGKRIGPVPIAVVAALALAAFLSAGLLVFMPSSTQAQTATDHIPDQTFDADVSADQTIETISVVAGDNNTPPAISRAFPVGSTDFTITSDQDDPETAADQTGTDDKNGGIETNSSGSGDRTGAIAIGTATGTITIPADIISQTHAEQSDNTARITVKAKSGSDDLTVRFNLTIVQNPFESGDNMVEPVAPDGSDDAGYQPVIGGDEGDCAVITTDGSTVLTGKGARTTGATLAATASDHDNDGGTPDRPTNLVTGGKCTTVAESVDVAFRNSRATGSANKVNYLVYVTGGDSFPNVDGHAGKSGLNQQLLTVDPVDALGDPGEKTITVTRSMADNAGKVYLYGYQERTGNDGPLSVKRIPSTTSQAFKVNADFVVQVQFVEGPALAFDADRSDLVFNAMAGSDDDVDGSTLEAASPATEKAGGQDQDQDGYFDGAYDIPNSSDAAIGVTATIKDSRGNPLYGGDKDSRVDFIVTYTAGSDLSSSTPPTYSTRKVIAQGANTASIDVDGWMASQKAVEVTVAATYTGPTAPNGFDLGAITLTRAGSAETAKFAIYSCAETPSENTKAANGCATGHASSEDMRFGRSQHFVVSGGFLNSLGSEADDTVDVEIAEADKKALTVLLNSAAPSRFNPGNTAKVVMITSEAAYGDYTITVTNGATGDSEVTQNLTISVAGPPARLTVTPEGNVYIPLRGRQTFTVSALDENGVTADFPKTSHQEILIDASYGDVRGPKVGSNDILTLNAATGMGTFTYTLPRDAMAGETFSIFVGTGDMQEEIMVTAGDAPAVPGMPMNVSAMADSDTQITVSWDAPASDGGSAITGYMVESMMSGGEWMDVTPTDLGTKTTFTHSGLMAATTYYYRVTATNAEGNSQATDGMAMAMTNAAPTPPMASGTLADVSLTVGDDAAMVNASGAFTMTEDDAITGYAATSSDTDVATASANAMGMVTIMAVGAGSATVSVTAMDDDGTSDAVTIMVTVAPDPTLGTPTGVDVSGFNRNGVLQVSWTAAPNAQSYIVIAVNSTDSEDTQTALVNDRTQTTAAVGGLTSGQTYYVFVAALGSGGANTLSEELVTVVAK